MQMSNRIVRGLSVAVISAVALVGCNSGAHGGGGDSIKPLLGTVIGGVAGGYAGSHIGGGSGKLWATGAGAVLGALIGNEIGKSLTRADKAYAAQATQATLERQPSGTTGQWRNPDSGNAGTVTPTRTYQTNRGRYCREFQQTVIVGGREQSAYGTACRMPDGSWQIQQ
jgi:surface antigen